MADQIKEIATATILPENLTGNQFSATIASTNASTKLRIVEIVGENGFGAACTLQVNNFKAADITNPPSGSAIVDVSSSVRAAFASPVSFIRTYLNGPTATSTYPVTRTSLINGTLVKTDTEILALSNNLQFGGLPSIAPDGDFFAYNQPTDVASGSGALIKRAGGPSGTQSNAFATTTDIAFDGVRYYYRVASSTSVIRFDIVTETSTNLTITGAALDGGSSNNRLIFTNGILVWLNGPGNNQFQAIDLTTNRCVNITGKSSFYDTNSTVACASFFYDRDSGTLRGLATDASANIRFNTVTGLVFSVGQTSVGCTEQNANSGIAFYEPDLIVNQGMGFLMLSLDTFYGQRAGGLSLYRVGVPAALSDAPLGFNNQQPRLMFTRTAQTSPTNADFPVSLKLRLAGVETT